MTRSTLPYRIARRTFLRGCAAAPLLLPLLRNLEARAQGLAAPLRFLVIRRPGGTEQNLWRPPAPATTGTFTLPSISAPFTPLQSKMVMVDGLNVVSAGANPTLMPGNRTSEGGTVALMTGQPMLGQVGQQDHCAGGRSIDQIFLDGSPLLGGPASPTPTRFPSLQLAADIRSMRDEVAPRVLSYRDPLPGVADLNRARQPLHPTTQPATVYDLLFAGAGPPPIGRGPRRSIVDFARHDLLRLRQIIPASEIPKLDVYADSLQQLDKALTVGGCTQPARPPIFVEGRAQVPDAFLTGVDYYDANDPDNHPHLILGRTQLSLIRAAFLCDLSRVATFSWASATTLVLFPGTLNGASIGGPTPQYPISQSPSAEVRAWLTQIDLIYAQQTAQFLQELAGTLDLDGNSLLDNTVVVYLSEIARAVDHEWRNVPFLVFGGKNTRVAGGRYLKVSDGSLAGIDGGTGNRPTNDAWLALAPIFKVALPSLGAPSQWTGPLPGLIT